MLILFTRVATPPATSPQTAIWDLGLHVPDTRASLAVYQARPDLELLPLYISDEAGAEGGSVLVSSDTWPSKGPTPGLTKAQIAEARASGAQPTRTGGFGYMRGWKPTAACLGDIPKSVSFRFISSFVPPWTVGRVRM